MPCSLRFAAVPPWKALKSEDGVLDGVPLRDWSRAEMQQQSFLQRKGVMGKVQDPELCKAQSALILMSVQ